MIISLAPMSYTPPLVSTVYRLALQMDPNTCRSGNNFFAFTGGLSTKKLRQSVIAPNCFRYPRAKSNIRSALEHIIEAVYTNTYGGSWLSPHSKSYTILTPPKFL
ncbi:hypothetical protein EYC84_008282 [Monilinia fructicola]|uniref:Uncharacterized protein n=1 Tax=Monilinia fructicola TaxID=38448 RepID=A0A5M9JGE7_MONFR|nr:hypothetical protein EYC84_008282 [Monilinia fructicola]